MAEPKDESAPIIRSADEAFASLLGGGVEFIGLARPTVYLMRSEQLSELETSTSRENTWCSLCIGSVSVLIGGAATVATASGLTSVALAVFAGSGIGLAGLTVMFGVLWRGAHCSRVGIMTNLRGQGTQRLRINYDGSITPVPPHAHNAGMSPTAETRR